MNCFYCENEPAPGGSQLHSIKASAVCLVCGRAVCNRHGKLDPRKVPSRTKCTFCHDQAQANSQA